MYKSILAIAALILVSCQTTTYYIVRHAEKESSASVADSTTMTGDVPLSKAGMQRAEALKEALKDENIQHIFATNYTRTKSTVQPLADAINIPVEVYDPKDSTFMDHLKSLQGNVVIVGHANTVDDLVNNLCGEKKITGDLSESEYGDLFVVRKNGNRMEFTKRHFGQ